MSRMRVACCQLDPRIGDRAGNLQRSRVAIAEAAAAGAHVIVLPELAGSGYAFASAADAGEYAETPDGLTLTAWCEATTRAEITVVGGFCELDPVHERVYNSAAVVEGGRVLAIHRKLHLWGDEQDWFSAGEAAAPVVATAHGRLGVGVCYDLEFPEVARGLALAGAQLLAFPTNWPRSATTPAGERPMLGTLAMATARLNRVYVAVCDRSGSERGLVFEGHSVIAGPDGWPLAETRDPDAPGTLLADCDLATATDKRLGARNDVFGDRRARFYT
jgi:predicted amidohydrolase